jgi:uncharacterized membrane protein YkoI
MKSLAGQPEISEENSFRTLMKTLFSRTSSQSGTERRRRSLCLWLALVVAVSLPAELYAGQQEPSYYAKPAGGISLEQAADTVRRQTGGRVLSATPVKKGGERGYNVRVLVDGKRVKQYYVDSEGRMSSR